MKRFSPHRWWLLTVLTAVPALSLAAGVPHLFTSGTVVSSAQVNENFAALADRLTALEARVPTTTYVRWGRTACEGDARITYAGYAAGKLSTSHVGSGVDTLCLPQTPEWLVFDDGSQEGALIYGAEYQTAGYGAGLGAVSNFPVPCVVCEVSRTAELMVPARTSCPEGWTLEYDGYLMSDHFSYQASDWLCVDAEPQTAVVQADADGHFLYPTEVECGVLPCGVDGYVQDRELTCAVCTK